MVLDGISEKGAHVMSNLRYLICLRHLIGTRVVTNRIFFSPKWPSCMRNMFRVTVWYKRQYGKGYNLSLFAFLQILNNINSNRSAECIYIALLETVLCYPGCGSGFRLTGSGSDPRDQGYESDQFTWIRVRYLGYDRY